MLSVDRNFIAAEWPCVFVLAVTVAQTHHLMYVPAPLRLHHHMSLSESAQPGNPLFSAPVAWTGVFSRFFSERVRVNAARPHARRSVLKKSSARNDFTSTSHIPFSTSVNKQRRIKQLHYAVEGTRWGT